MFQKLEVISIEKCPSFELILPFLSVFQKCPALISITIKSCDKLKYIFGQDLKLESLEKMELSDIPILIDIFPECNRTMSLSIKKPPSISGDASEQQEQSDPIKFNIFS
ncbi:putative leucine-rich repeat domain, L domain-containing protein [Medicago truncatula]|nr:putative leucine-rich repeat domain, L domain-containing protein [Medicago truncatula]